MLSRLWGIVHSWSTLYSTMIPSNRSVACCERQPHLWGAVYGGPQIWMALSIPIRASGNSLGRRCMAKCWSGEEIETPFCSAPAGSYHSYLSSRAKIIVVQPRPLNVDYTGLTASKKYCNLWKGTMARMGYARVSSIGQSLALQLDKLRHCDKLLQETRSGATGKRPRLSAC